MENLLGKIDPQTADALMQLIHESVDRSMFANLEIEKISLSPAAASTDYSDEHITDIRHKRIIGIAFNLTDEDELVGCTFSMKIDSKEVFASGTEAKLIFASTGVSPKDRFYPYVDREINQTRVDTVFTTPSTFTNAFTANFYLLCVPKE